MTPRITPRAAALPALLMLGVLAVAYARTLAPGITWANSAADSGDLATAVLTAGVPHPSGYPTYVLLARATLLLPHGDPAALLAGLSATLMAAAALAVLLLVLRLRDDQAGSTLLAATAAALGFGLAALPWSLAVVPEVYALNALFTALLLLALLRSLGDGRAAPVLGLLEGLLAGLALGNHLTVALAVLAWAGVRVWRHARGGTPAAVVLGAPAAGMALGLLVYLYPPLAARAGAPLAWEDPQTAEGFWRLVSGAAYQQLTLSVTSPVLAQRVAALAGLLLRQFGPIGVALGFAGLLYCPAAARSFVRLSAALAIGWSLFALSYGTADSTAYLVPALLVFAVWIGLGAARALDLLRGRVWPMRAVGAALLAAVLLPVLWTAPAVDASRDTRAIDFAREVLEQAPRGAVLLTGEDRDTFALWYAHIGLRQRPDVAVVAEPLLEDAWYRASLRAAYPHLAVPTEGDPAWHALVCRTFPDGPRPLDCEPVPR